MVANIEALRGPARSPVCRALVWSLVGGSMLFTIAVMAVFPKALIERFLPDQTVYADGFSEIALGKVTPGMTEEDVLRVVGRPLLVSEFAGSHEYESSWAPGPSAVTGVEFKWWAYTKAGRLSESYKVRAVKFSRDGKVSEVLRRDYID